jgi:hypothetical protein
MKAIASMPDPCFQARRSSNSNQRRNLCFSNLRLQLAACLVNSLSSKQARVCLDNLKRRRRLQVYLAVNLRLPNHKDCLVQQARPQPRLLAASRWDKLVDCFNSRSNNSNSHLAARLNRPPLCLELNPRLKLRRLLANLPKRPRHLDSLPPRQALRLVDNRRF